MKDWDYYRNPKDLEYFGRKTETEYKERLIHEINSDPLTAADRIKRLGSVKALVRNHMEELNAPYNAELKRLEDEFWHDAREEIGYPMWLNKDGVASLEHRAYEDGHSNGFSEIFWHLQDLSDWLHEMKDRFL